jgi:tellurite resistance-related uncharacterized protein
MTDPWPDNLVKYAETKKFTEKTVPEKLTAEHDTKAGVWGKLTVYEGCLDYVLADAPTAGQTIHAGQTAIIEPQVRHWVEISVPVLFQVEFYRAADAT